MRARGQMLIVGLMAAMLLLAACGVKLANPMPGRPLSEAEKVATQPANVPGGDPVGTAAAYFKKLKGMPPITQPVMFGTSEADEIMKHVQVFPETNPFYEDISNRPVAPNSDAMIATMKSRRQLGCNRDMSYIIIPPNQKLIDIKITGYPDEADPGPYRIPDNAPVEGWSLADKTPLADYQAVQDGADRHVVVVDPVHGLLFELFQGARVNGVWTASGEATFDLKTNALRPEGWTSSDAAGLPLLPLTVHYNDVASGEVKHAVRVTVSRTDNSWVYPASHRASSHTNPNFPRMGERFRLKASYDISKFPPHLRAIAKGLKKYGMINADNGQDWLISVSPDPRIVDLDLIGQMKATDFEVIVPTGPNEGPRAPK